MSNVHWSGRSLRQVRRLLRSYGLGLLFAANIFGAGSIYILTSAGATYGFVLLWVLPASLFVGLAAHEMSARLAVVDEPLMVYIREVIGPRPAKAFAVGIAFVMHFWSVANYALAGAAVAYLTPLSNVLAATLLCAAAGYALVEVRVYQRVETVIAVLVLAVFGSYLLILSGVDVPLGEVARGAVPTLATDVGYLTMVIALVGTTIYYPNFFIQTSMHEHKRFETLDRYRRDHTVGLVAAVVLSVSVLVVAAITVPPDAATISIEAPALPLADHVGSWALPVFLVAAGAASFTSATGTLFAAGFMVPQAFGYESLFGDRRFRRVVEALIVSSVVLALPILAFTDFTPVRLALLMPAANGVIGLPLTVLALYSAVHHHGDVSRLADAAFVVATGLMVVASLVTARSLAQSIGALL